MLDRFQEEHDLTSPAEIELIEIVKHNLQIIQDCKEHLKEHAKTSGLPYGIVKANGTEYQSPVLKIKLESEKMVLSCFRQFDIKGNKKKSENTPKGIEKLMKSS